MRHILNKGFEALGRREEKREERMDALLTRHVDAMSDKRTLKLYASILGGINFLLWAAVLLRPFDVKLAFEKIGSVDDKLVMLTLGFLFGVGMWLTYSVFRLLIPDLEERVDGSELMSSFADQERMSRKVRVWVASVAGGVINLLALAIVEGLLIS